MMLDWSEYHKQGGTGLGELMKLSPDTVRGYRMLSEANAQTGHLDAKPVSSFRLPWASHVSATAASWCTPTPR